MADTTKTFLGKYELLEVIGDGAEGRVYRARCTAGDIPGVAKGELLAVKRLKSTGHEKESQMFRRQIEILSKLNHPNIVRYKDSFIWRDKDLGEDIHCLVMELLDGEPLKGLIEKNSSGLGWEIASDILSQTLQALQYASQNSIVHRDLKPSNIFITLRGIPKLVDFGIARQEDSESTATSTQAGAKGTFDYMAPDFALQTGDFRGDEQSDIFSFGVIFYFVLTGKLPFPALGENADRGYYIRWLGQKPPTADFRHEVFRVMSHARTCISKCIDPDRQARFKTFDEVMGDFAQVSYRKLKHAGEVYEFTGWLGKGGFGEVFRGRRMRDMRQVAIKRLFSSGQSARFVREAKILRATAHPNLTEYIDFVEVQIRDDEREYYLVLEYLEGMPDAGLRDRIKASNGGMDPVETLRLFVGYLDCLEQLHQNGIIHRDIKPGNLYAPAGHPERAKIFDLGIAHDEEGTRTHGQMPGTLDFMPPEFAMQTSGRGSAQSDIFSIGTTLYQCLTQKLPFPRLPVKEAEAWVAFFRRSEKLPDLVFDHPVFKTHPEVIPLIRYSLAQDPKRRYDSAAKMRDEIKTVLRLWNVSLTHQPEEEEATVIMARSDFAPPPPPEVEVPEPPAPPIEVAEEPDAAELETKVADLNRIEREMAQSAPKPPPAPPAVDPAELERQRLVAEEAEKQKREQAEAARIKAQEEAEKRTQEEKRLAAEAAIRDKEKAEELAKEKARLAEVARLKAIEDEKRLAEEKKRQAEEAAVREKEKAEQLAKEKVRLAELARLKAIEDEKRLAEEKKRQAEEAARREKERAEQAVRDAERKAAEEVRRKEREAAEKVERERQRVLAEEAAARKRIEDEKRAKIRAEKAAQMRRTMAKVAKVGGVIAAVVLLAVGGYIGWGKMQASMRESAYNTASAQAQSDFNSGDYNGAIAQAQKALDIHKDDPAMQKLVGDAGVQIKLHESYDNAIKDCQAAFDSGDYTNAVILSTAALQKMPNDLTATKLQADSQRFLNTYHTAVSAANDAYHNGDYAAAEANADKALAVYKNNVAMQQLKASAAAQMAALAAYRQAMRSAQSAFDNNDYTNAVNLAGQALLKIPNDDGATHLRENAQKYLDDYHTAVDAANTAFRNNDFVGAVANADKALAIYGNDDAMKQIKSSSHDRAENAAAYRQAMQKAQAAFDNHDYSAAATDTATALQKIPGDASATRLHNSAQKFLDDYHAAVAAANAAYKNGDFAGTVANAGKALAIYPTDTAMQQVRTAAQTRIDNLAAYTHALQSAQAAMDGLDYASAQSFANTALEKNPGDPAATKIRDTAAQQLGAFTDIVTKAQAAYHSGDFPTAIALNTKALAIRKDDPTSLTLKATLLRQLDVNLVTLLESFNVSVPSELASVQHKKAATMGAIGNDGRTYYQSQVDKLEKTYRAGNWLGESNRQTSIHDLRKAIDSWE